MIIVLVVPWFVLILVLGVVRDNGCRFIGLLRFSRKIFGPLYSRLAYTNISIMKQRAVPRKPKASQPRRTEPAAPRRARTSEARQDVLPPPAALPRKAKQKLPQLRLIDGSVQR